MKPEFKMALVAWKDSIQDREIKHIEIYESPIKSGEYFLKLKQSTKISFGDEHIEIHCEGKLYTIGQTDSSHTSKVDLHRLETAIRSITQECDERIATAIETLISQTRMDQSPKKLDDFF